MGYKMVNGIRGLYSPCSRPKGTCFSLDSTVHSAAGLSGDDMMEFERNLAAIIALTQPVSNENNPFFLNKFYQTFTWAADSDWQCKENCAAAQVLLSNPVDQHVTELLPTTSGLRYFGCYLCRYQFDGQFRSGKCHVNTDKNKELMVAFVNSKFDDTPPASWPCNTMNRVIIGTDPASSLTDMHNWAVTPASDFGQFWSSGLAYQIPFNHNNLMATRKLLSCIGNKCCANEPPAKKRSTSDQDSFYYLTKESISECGGQSNDCQPKLKEFSGRSDDFIKQVVIPETQNNDHDQDPCRNVSCRPPKRCFDGKCFDPDCGQCSNESPPGWNHEVCPGDCNSVAGSPESKSICEMKFDLFEDCFVNSNYFEKYSNDYIKDWCKCTCDNCEQAEGPNDAHPVKGK